MPKYLAHDYNGEIFEQRLEDGYMNLTRMAALNGKLVGHWLENKGTEELLIAFEEEQILNTQESDNKKFPLISKRGRYGGTWAHPDIAIIFAQWCNPHFALFVSRLVREWMTNPRRDGGSWQQARLSGIEVRSDFTLAVKSHADSQTHRSPAYAQFLYPNATDHLYLLMFGLKAAGIRDVLNLERGSNIRPYLTEPELSEVKAIERAAARFINSDGIEPKDAVFKGWDGAGRPEYPRIKQLEARMLN